MKHLLTRQKIYLIFAALFYALLFYTNYVAVIFLYFSQMLWFYRTDSQKPTRSWDSVLLFNGMILLLCAPWLIFLGSAFTGPAPQWISNPFDQEPLFFWRILSGVFHDWLPFSPLTASSIFICLISLVFTRQRGNKLILITVFFFPVLTFYLIFRTTGVFHVVASRYFIGQLPILFILIFLSAADIESQKMIFLKKIRLRALFLLLFVATNLTILPVYYRSEKQNFRGLAGYLKQHLRPGDRIYDADARLVGVLHYFQTPTDGRFYQLDYYDYSKGKEEFRKSFLYNGTVFNIYFSRTCCEQFLDGKNRLWIIAGTKSAELVKQNIPSTLVGYFDGSFFQGTRFPTDASMYLFLWDPRLANGKGIDLPVQ